MAFMVVAMFAAFGCQKQEAQQPQGGGQTAPESAPTSTAPAAPAPEQK